MKQNKLIIQINKPLAQVFEFTTNPKNTNTWVDSIVTEQTNEWPIKLGSIYKSQNESGNWSEYTVSAFELNKLFELTAEDKNYHVRYTYKALNNNETQMEYYEWVDKGELDGPFKQEVLDKLKVIIENI